MSSPDHSSLFPPVPFIGRERELAQLDGALGRRAFFYVIGDGGMGKTRLMRQLHSRVWPRADMLETGVIDLQEGRYLQPLLLMQTLVRRLRRSFERHNHDPQAIFTEYDTAVTRYLQSSTGREFYTDTDREKVEAAFLLGFAALTRRFPVLVQLDTFEKLHPVIPEVKSYNFRADQRLERWLVGLMAKFPPRTTLVIAGRQNAEQQHMLASKLERRLRTLEMRPFSEAETSDYIRAHDSSLIGLLPTLHSISGGRPVVLALALAMARLAAARGETWAPSDLECAYPDNQEALSRAFVRSVIADMARTAPEQLDLLNKALYLRKGLSVNLLPYLEPDTDPMQLQQQVDRFRVLPFVKSLDARGGVHRFSLHDEMYELLFEQLSQAQRNRWYQAVIEYLEAQLAAPLTKSGIEAIVDRHAQRNELLYYQMALDPVRGYQAYQEFFETVINSRNEDLDAQLQDDLARFYDNETRWGRDYRRRLVRSGFSWEEIACDEAIRWVRRRLRTELQGRNRHLEALEMANRIGEDFTKPLQRNELLRQRLRVVTLEARVYVATTDEDRWEIESGFGEAIDALSGLQKHEQSTAHPFYPEQQILLALAEAYNMRGYHRRLEQRYHSAIDDYRMAVQIYKDLGPESEGTRAQALIDLSFALGEQGQTDEALACADSALRLAKQEGARHLAATALNTLARIRRFSNPFQALRHAEQARILYEEQQSVRGLALCALAEGLVCTNLAMLTGFDSPEGKTYYDRGLTRFVEARNLFDARLPSEVARRIEVRIGLGSLYRERGLAASQPEMRTEAFGKAREVLYEAQDLVREAPATPGPIVVSLIEDLVVMNEAEGLYEEALTWIFKARSSIPEHYGIKPNIGITENEKTREEQVYWLRLSQLELQTALCHLGLGEALPACLALQRAFAYVLVFSRDARPLTTFRTLGRSALLRVLQKQPDRLVTLREETNYYAVIHRIEREARAEMERIFLAVEDGLGFLA